MKLLDRYIIRKFLGTYFLTIALIVFIAIIFDASEKMDDFIERNAPLRAILFDYYLNFIPFFVNLFSPLFIFIAVIYFTSRLAANTEIVAMLNSGMSFRRLMLPYFITASFLAIVTFYLNVSVIPHANKNRLEFEWTYIRNPFVFKERNIHRQISPGTLIYMDSYNNREDIGFRFSLERIKDGKRVFFLNSDRIRWDSVPQRWVIENYFIRTVNGLHEEIRHGLRLDTTLAMQPKDFRQRISAIDAMDNAALSEFIKELKQQGNSNYMPYLVEKYRRFAFPFATFILTLIGVSLASRKVRGGIGLHLGAGIGLSFSYILFLQVSTTFAINGDLPPLFAVWIPNIVFAGIAAALFRMAPK